MYRPNDSRAAASGVTTATEVAAAYADHLRAWAGRSCGLNNLIRKVGGLCKTRRQEVFGD
jgi:hypothetical protein